jgi:hypothetical protein
MEEKLDADYWNNRYASSETGWDLNAVSPPIQQYFDRIEKHDLKILIPGAGNAWEAEYLYKQGFQQVHLLDYAAIAINNFKKRLPHFPDSQLHCEDFFAHTGLYDCIVEQTFFCALEPSLRGKYVEKMSYLLKPAGKLVGLLFNIPLNTDKPPFGGNMEEYSKLFESHLNIIEMDQAKNSIKPRENNELFFICNKDKHSSTKS